MSGTIAGGIGSLDGFAVFDGVGNLTAFQPAGDDASGTTTVAGKTVTYTGMDRYNPLSGDAANLVFTGSIFDRDIWLEDATALDPGQMKVSFSNLSFTQRRQQLHLRQPDRVADPDHRVGRRHDHRGVARPRLSRAPCCSTARGC